MFTRPDNGVYPSTVLSSDIDNAELAARLGIIRLRRSGRVVFYDDFSSGLAWSINGLATSGIYSLYGGKYPYTPPALAFLHGQQNTYANMFAHIPPLAINMLGVEYTFAFDDTGLPNLANFIDITVEGNNAKAGIRLDTANTQLMYWNSAGAWQAITGYVVGLTTTGWYNLKFVVNLLTLEYHRLYFGKDKIDIYGLPCDPVIADEYLITISVYDDSPSPAGVVIDNVIITMDEFS